MNPEKIVVGPFNSGLKTDKEPFYIDNDSFPVLVNAYQWRGRVKRRRGTSLLGRLTRYFESNLAVYSPTKTIVLDGNGQGNVFSGIGLESTGTLVPGTGVFFSTTSGQTYRDLFSNSYLLPTGTGGPNRINYSTGEITIPAESGSSIRLQFNYYPGLPVMGIEELNLNPQVEPGTIVFDTVYSYNISSTVPYNINDVSFYKNPSTGLYSSYIEKTTWTRTNWSGTDYQQFWTKNYQGALWATNGVTNPFNASNIGMQFAPAGSITYNAFTATTLTVSITNCPLEIGDFVFLNEWLDAAAESAGDLNFQSGYVTAAAGGFALKTLTITFPNANLTDGPYTPGIIQYLTNVSDSSKDCIRWYDGDPTDGNPTSPTFITGKGWVNFMPPISRSNYSIADLPARQYYLVGAKIIQPYKDRLLFVGPVIQASTGNAIYLQDTIIFSQNGTPFYTASFNGDPALATTEFNQILVPENQTATANAYWSDQTGFGGFIQAGINQAILTGENNEDVLILGCPSVQMRLVYTGNDIIPFNFYLIDNNLSTTSTFSSINVGDGIITKGNRGLINTTQNISSRIDLEIPDQFFQVGLTQNGNDRFTAQRDFLNEWIYFTYRSNQDEWKFPTETLLYNYRDRSWGIYKETFTAYGQFSKKTGYTWANIGDVYETWDAWNTPWNSGASTLLAPEVLCGTQHGFLLLRISGTSEGNTIFIKDYDGTTITSPNHCLNEGDYIIIKGSTAITGFNNNIYSVSAPVTTNTFRLNPQPNTTGTYYGNGVIRRMYVPFIQTKQFPVAWGLGRKTRIGTQKYLLTTTKAGKMTLLIFLSQDEATPYNTNSVFNNSLIYTSTLFTSSEIMSSYSNFRNNIMMIANNVGKTGQNKIWHRINTSLIGDTVQLGFTLSDQQMRDTNFANQFAEIELHGFILDVYPSQLLC